MKKPPRSPNRLLTRLPRHAVTAENIGRRILGGDLAPGVTLPNAAALAREYKLSRPALREAIKLLAGKGLVSAAPRRGTVVRPRRDWNRLDDDVVAWEADEAPTPQFIRDLFELRRMVEPEAAALAAERASDAGVAEIGAAVDAMAASDPTSDQSIGADLTFHRAILTHSGNEFLATFGPAIAASLRIAFKTQRRAHVDNEHFIPRHRAIHAAIAARRPAEARSAVLKLLTNAEDDAVDSLSVSQPHPLSA